MEGYAAEPDRAFARSRQCFGELARWLAVGGTAG